MNKTIPVPQENVEDILGLSPVQEGILFACLKKPDSNVYTAKMTLFLYGKIDFALLKKACKSVTMEHEMLRTVFRWERLSNPIQIILKNHEIPLFIHELSLHERERMRETIWNEGIDIRLHPIRLVLYKTDSNQYELDVYWHHIVYDGWSNGIFLRDLIDAYSGLKKGMLPKKKVKGRYRDFIKWCRQQNTEHQRNFWRDYFSGFQATSPLPVDRNGMSGVNAERGEYRFELSANMSSSLSAFQVKEGITFADLLYCAWSVVLYSYTRADDIVFGFTVSGRGADVSGIGNMIGLFINTLPLRVMIEADMKLNDVLRQISERKNSSIIYESTDLARIKESSSIPAKEKVFDSVVVVENYPLNLQKWWTGEETGFAVDSYSIYERTEYSLVVGTMPYKNEMMIQYDTSLYTKSFVKQLAESYRHIVHMIAEDGEQTVSSTLLFSENGQEDALKLMDLGQRVLPTPAIVAESEHVDGTVEYEIEKNIEKVWKKMLKLDFINRNTSFIDLGADSRLVLRMVAELSKIYPDSIGVQDVFTYPTIEQLTKFLALKISDTREVAPVLFRDTANLSIPFSADYFKTPDEALPVASMLSYEFQREEENRLTQFVLDSGIDKRHLILASYFYSIALLTQKKEISIQVMLHDEDRISSVLMDFNEINDIQMLLRKLKDGIKQRRKTEGYKLHTICNVEYEKQTGFVIPLFYELAGDSFPAEFMKLYDFALTYIDMDGGTYTVFRYDTSRIQTHKAEELFRMIINCTVEFVRILS